MLAFALENGLCKDVAIHPVKVHVLWRSCHVVLAVALNVQAWSLVVLQEVLLFIIG